VVRNRPEPLNRQIVRNRQELSSSSSQRKRKPKFKSAASAAGPALGTFAEMARVRSLASGGSPLPYGRYSNVTVAKKSKRYPFSGHASARRSCTCARPAVRAVRRDALDRDMGEAEKDLAAAVVMTAGDPGAAMVAELTGLG
jgi:hypothetical protein